ncbi:alpha-L-fucosidase [Streptomyces sp. B5E4]|uniref:alpha-L-fucosidase n=1 Tax=Streptomyces sp. B5E4 TaxID=3153568 RepID=UPI00325CDA87
MPTRGQLAWQRREVTAFTHFGMNTLTDREWGSGAEDPALFDPGRVDVAQWMRTYKARGAEMAMLTAKHHDGFNLYPTRYSDHCVAAGPHSRDLLGTYVREARKAGLDVGVYLSPSDGAELPHAWHAGWLADLPFDRVRLAEDIRHGQRVERFAVLAQDPATGRWHRIAAGTTIGAYRSCRRPRRSRRRGCGYGWRRPAARRGCCR